MERIRAGGPGTGCGTDSYGNGGAMRVGVLGAYYPDDPEGWPGPPWSNAP
jgi:ADP-ribosylglycohydrolase